MHRQWLIANIFVALVAGVGTGSAVIAQEEEPPIVEELLDDGGLGDGDLDLDSEDWDSVTEEWDADADGSSGTTTHSAPAPPPALAVASMAVFMLFYFAFIFLMVFGQLAIFVVKLIGLYDCARRDFDDPNTRALWCIVIVFIPLLGAIIYYFAVYKDNTPPIQLQRPPVAVIQ
ncbi:MAG TPA: PLD nuclease N-terminal domain-containing protein [Armatimonadota bacterium]|nr:PLD nuclease N-terminal domain-containing protein [Armatimonadota bacterium]